MTKFLIANWKANPTAPHDAVKLLRATARAVGRRRKVTVVVTPPTIYLEAFWGIIKKEKLPIKLGAQDLFWEKSGPYTSQITAPMLRTLGVSCCLVGHSERRAVGETDEQINKKIKAALAARITPILLVGEQEKNDAIRQDILVDQLTRDLEGVSPKDASRIMYAFEPAWAISTTSGNKAESLDNIIAGIAMMKDIICRFFKLRPANAKLSFLYGASVNGENVADILSRKELSGAVVGGASLRAEEFKKMIEITSTKS